MPVPVPRYAKARVQRRTFVLPAASGSTSPRRQTLSRSSRPRNLGKWRNLPSMEAPLETVWYLNGPFICTTRATGAEVTLPPAKGYCVSENDELCRQSHHRSSDTDRAYASHLGPWPHASHSSNHELHVSPLFFRRSSTCNRV